MAASHASGHSRRSKFFGQVSHRANVENSAVAQIRCFSQPIPQNREQADAIE
jgi:hypothetical protein